LASSRTSFQFCRLVDYCVFVTFNRYIMSRSNWMSTFTYCHSPHFSSIPFRIFLDIKHGSYSIRVSVRLEPSSKHQQTNFLSSSVAYHTLAFTAVAFFNLYLSSAILIGMKGFITHSEGFVTILSPVSIRTNQNQRCAASRL
jgi:hypothetical protein